MIAPSSTQQLSAGAMALLVHGLFIAALVFSVSWRAVPQLPVYADLWDALPPLPLPEVSPPAEPAADTTPSAPLPEPAAATPPARPDIALRDKEAQERREAARRLDEETRLEAARRQEEQLRQAAEEARQREQQRVAEERLRAAESKRVALEQARRELEAEMARQVEEELAREAERLRRAQQRQAAAALSLRSRQILEHQELIRVQIHQHLRRCDKVAGNPEVIFRAQLIPGGELLRLQLLQSSGSAVCDQDVERAVLKAFPLPLPADKEAARAFTREPLELKLRPNEAPASDGRA